MFCISAVLFGGHEYNSIINITSTNTLDRHRLRMKSQWITQERCENNDLILPQQ